MRKLRSKLLLSFVLVTITPVLLTGIVGVAVASRQLHRMARQRVNADKAGVEIEIDSETEDLLIGTKGLAKAGELADALADRDHQSLLRLLGRARYVLRVDAISAVDPEGVVLARAHLPTASGDEPPPRQIVASAMKGKPMAGIVKTDLGIALEAAAPVEADGHAVGALYVQDVLDYGFARRIKARFGIETTIFADGRLQATTFTDPERIKDLIAYNQGKQGNPQALGKTTEVHLSGADHFVGGVLVGSEQTKGAILLGFSQEVIRETILSVINLDVLIALVLLAGAIAASWFITRDIVRPIMALRDTTRKIAAGDRGARVAIESPNEVGELGRAFNEMADALATSTTSIENLHAEIAERKQAERDRARMEAQLLQAQKMEAVGQLAGGVAHDFNNILQGILGYADLSIAMISADNLLAENLAEIKKATERAGTLTRQLLALGRRETISPAAVDLNVLILDLTNMLSRVIGEPIELRFKPGRDIPPVHADAGRIEQVIMNLVLNARDAMPDGGRLTIATEAVDVDESYLEENPWARQGRFVLLSIADTGVGMPAEVLEHVYEPFFTTGARPERAGMGLAIVYGIVKQHDGIINVESTPGVGTIFKVGLPVSEGEATGKPRQAAMNEHVAGGSETILLAEDDETVRNLTVKILQNAGYTVIDAVDGDEALELLQRHADRIDLAILDAVMPKRSGKQVYDQIRQRWGDMPVLFASGYSYETLQKGHLPEDCQLIAKPYRQEDLLKAIRQILDSRPN